MKAKKGTVVVQPCRGRLRLVWTFEGKRYFLTLGLPDSKLCRAKAGMVATRIEEDIRTDNFDVTLTKYKAIDEPQSLPLISLFNLYVKFKNPEWQRNTLDKHRALAIHLEDFFGQSNADITHKEAVEFLGVLGRQMKPATLRDRASILRSCWSWGVQQKLVDDNPWAQVQLRKTPLPEPKPFTESEVAQILEYFRSSYYLDFVRFKLGTGMRTGEVVGLQWQHITQDCSAIVISSTITKGIRKPTKTGKPREFTLSPQLQNLLLTRRNVDYHPSDLVFPGPKGAPIDAKNFANRHWKPALQALGIPYRRPYITRATFVSHALDQGVNPGQVCAITGHQQETMYRHYAGRVRKAELPSLFSD